MTEETIFHEALACPSRQERDVFVARACGGDVSLFSRVQGLLTAHDSPDAYLARPAGGQIKTLDYQPVQHQVGSAIGSWNKSAKGEWAWCTWPSCSGPCVAWWR